MQIAFVTVAAVGLLYFSLAKRRFDFFSVAFYSACVYFLPGFFGYAMRISSSGEARTADYIPLVSETYLVFVLILSAILLAAIAMDHLVRDSEWDATLRGSENAVLWAAGFALAGFIITLATLGETLLSADKRQILDSFGASHLAWTTGASLGFALATKQRRWALLALCTVLLLADLYVGSRMSFANAVIAAFVIRLSDYGRQRFILKNWKIAVAGAGLAAAFFLYKQIYIDVKLGMWERLWQRMYGLDLYVKAISNSEPFITQTILNEVMKEEFHVGLEHFGSVVYKLVPFYDPPGGLTSFNALFQPVLFPRARSGLANNIWAEMWSSGGWPLLIVFVSLFVMLLASGSYLLRVQDPTIVGGAALLFSYWSFYLHRNDLLFQISITKNILVFWAVCVLLAISMAALTKRISYSQTSKKRIPERTSDTLPK